VGQLSPSGYRSLFGLDGATYQPHPLHGPARTYRETDCYTDIVIELLHARGDEPQAALASLVRCDFEGDQWTFFKPPPGDIETLYGIDIHEMQPYRPLPLQIAELIDAGSTMIVELDSFHLPDTHATAYQREHVKSSAIPEAIDLERELLRYFHNTGLHELEGADFRGLFRLDGAPDPAILPPYTEIVRFDAGPRLSGDALRARSRELLTGHLRHRPASDPFERFAEQLERELPALLRGELELYHAYAFATVRMAGAAFELLASYVDWLAGGRGAAAITASLQAIGEGCTTLGYRLARRREFDPRPLIEPLSAAWTVSMERLEEAGG
jgi:hypothetical protein